MTTGHRSDSTLNELRSGLVEATTAFLLALFATWLVASGRSSGTVKLRTYYLERLERETGRPLVEMDRLDLLAYLSRPDWSPETRKAVRSSLVVFYGWAVEYGHLEHNPAAGLPTVTVPAGAPRPTPDHVLARALLAANDRDRLMLLLAAYAGLRRAEIARVHPRDFTLDGLRVHGKGGRKRLVPVHPELAEAVRLELERRARGGHGSGFRFHQGVTVDGPLFPNQHGEPVGPHVVGKRLARLLGGGWTGHTLRHRFGTKSYAVERDIRAVQELLGHSKVETTARYVQTPTQAKVTAVLASGLIA